MVVYDEAVKWFGIVEVGAGSGKKAVSFKKRRKEQIDSMIEERTKRKVRSKIEKNGYEALLRVMVDESEEGWDRRRQKQREMRGL